ncbi:MAG: heme exporter protein CcmB [Gammaproteobacteria bacterium PRO9]|nr:heme exporter protein CcmB [Gammaproteobacteria bacterium PRO9]
MALAPGEPAATVGLFRLFGIILGRDLRVGLRRWTDATNSALFFILVVTLFPLALSPKADALRAIAPGVLWIAALLASLLSLHLLFRADLEDGTLEQLLLLPHPLGWMLLAKVTAHWLITGIPVVVVAPVLAITYHLPGRALGILTLTLLLGTPTLSLMGSIGAALTAGLRGSGVLLAFIVAPLMLPVLILGARATDLALAGENPTGPIYLLGALLLLAVSLAPVIAAGAVRVSAD